MNNDSPVRCGSKTPTPYLREHYAKLEGPAGWPSSKGVVVDLGCGNLRNTEFLRRNGFSVIPVDRHPVDNTVRMCDLGVDRLPVDSYSVDAVIANYVFMFMTPNERRHLVKEIQRVLGFGSVVMVELYPAKKSYTPTAAKIRELQDEIVGQLGYHTMLDNSKHRFIARLEC